MSISFPLAFPTHKNVRGITLRTRKVVAANTSPGSLISQVYEWPGERWEAEFTLAPMKRENADAWIAWLTSLRGPVGSFLMGDPARRTPRGGAAATPGTPQVRGNQSVGARQLSIKTGISGPGVAGYLLAGSYLSVGTGSSRRLHRVLIDCDLDPSGFSTCEIWPALRYNLADNEAVHLTDTTSKFMLSATSAEEAIDNASVMRPAVVGCVEDLRI